MAMATTASVPRTPPPAHRNHSHPEYEHGVPVIDLSSADDDEAVTTQIAAACSSFGFFQVTSHGIPATLIDAFREEMKLFFDQTHEQKMALKRDEKNSRGFFDDELTKRRKDWKEGFDFGVTGSREWDRDYDGGADADGCLDGYNRFPDSEALPNFRPTVVRYFEACAELSDRLAVLMGRGLGVDENGHGEAAEKEVGEGLLENLRRKHSSYLRMNYYPPCPPEASGAVPLGISPHTDAGFLTVLSQDDGCHSLQVARRWAADESTSFSHEGEDLGWVTVKPVLGALTINTGDMAMIWSNGRYRAPLHRVRTDPSKVRYSAPFFYNPGYDAMVKPLPFGGEAPKYCPCSWGYFRAVRFAGDLTDLGVEIQISDFEIVVRKQREGVQEEEGKIEGISDHTSKQEAFLAKARFNEPFSVKRYRPLLQGSCAPKQYTSAIQ